jgi:hypothetical protein
MDQIKRKQKSMVMSCKSIRWRVSIFVVDIETYSILKFAIESYFILTISQLVGHKIR